MPVYPHKCDFGTIFDFQGSQNLPLERPFRPKNQPLSYPARVGIVARSVLEPTWARPAAQNGPRTHFHRFGMDFGQICTDFNGFHVDLDGFSQTLGGF